MEEEDRPESPRPGGFRPFKSLAQVATAIARTAGNAIALVEDAELRKKASDLVVGQAKGGFNTVRQGVATGAGTIQHRIRSGPAQVQSVLSTLQKRIEEQRLLMALKEERDEPVDVQIGPQLYEKAPQELRSRLWIALLDNNTLANSLEHSALSRNGSELSSSRPASALRQSTSGLGNGRPDMLPEAGEDEQLEENGEASQAGSEQLQPHTGACDAAGQQEALSGETSATLAATADRATEDAATDSLAAPSAADAGSPQAAGGQQPADADGTASAAEVSESPATAAVGASEAAAGAAEGDATPPAMEAEQQRDQFTASITAPPVSPADPYSFVRRTAAAAASDSPQPSPRTAGYGWARQKSRQSERWTEWQAGSEGERQLSPRMAEARQAAESADRIGMDVAAADAASGIAAEAAAAVAAAAAAGVTLPGAAGSHSAGQSGTSNGSTAAAGGGAAQQSPAQQAAQRLRHVSTRHAAELEQRQSADGASSSTSKSGNGHLTDAAAAAASPPGSQALSAQHSPAAPAPFDADFHGFTRQSGDLDAWEMVQDGGALYNFEGSTGLSARLHPAAHAQLSPEDVAIWQKLMVAIMTVPWPISTEFPEDCRYNTLLQISIGQEETDDIISRDINRTFPEHPQFGFEQGQQALFRVLKAYSLHDLEVNYCQGMAFVAGIILMYLPEEPAFRMLARLLDERGPDLRRLYLPGLEGLKQQLRALEWLMERHFPALAAHLQAHTVAPVLYASQWFLTLFACPFPSAFSARIIDIILLEGHSEILLQAALAVVAQCEAALLELDDFEDLITHLKVEPVRWDQQRQRKVLNAAVTSVVTSEMIRAATFAVTTGYCGSLSRRTSSRQDLSTAAAAAAAVASHSRNRSFSGPAQPSSGVSANDLSDALAAVELSPDSVAAVSELAEAPLGTDDLELVLAMDMLMEPSTGDAASRVDMQSSAPSGQMEPIPEHVSADAQHEETVTANKGSA